MSRWDTGLCTLCPTGMPPFPPGPVHRPSIHHLSGLSGREPLPRTSWEPREVWGVGGLPFEVSVVGAGGYLAEQLAGLRGLYLKVAGRLKIEEFQLGRESCCSVSPATPGSGPPPSAAAGCWGRGLAPPTLRSLTPLPTCRVCPGLGLAMGPLDQYMGPG